MSLILAIDPGKRGASILFNEGYPWQVTSFIHTPKWWHVVNAVCKFYQPDLCAFEDVHEMPNQGSTTTAILIANRERAWTAVDLANVPIKLYRPQEWQHRLGVPKFYNLDTKAKRRTARNKWLREWALERWPHLKERDKKLLTTENEMEKPDIWAAVGIGRAAYLDSIHAPVGQT